ncbi:ImmA/IrrE family metallo-endopeptidase [Paenibacillus polymyxa]|uniref:ImmA/IrrE family metallo-endopeptidase n=1 Tax=Paenibacillus TaxID=44249 RepID=UPI0025B63DF9|nr:ImmA/IrrE family metallo-endopeptidase [Paenibacillus polymyxa]MDN4078155.1 ImmA/IrrE family metallo-endopeptidase [Paenibacillus polymyxa]MDN4103576.1 ImmA/IrrE family metallo-endopeptidase [Paenibacillus polymyxa]MDN4113791.1 ImmA/IrrE family metallo-endopeptidase [Paenibacillus polymyxa]
MIPYYRPTENELLICDLYQTLNINYPHELDIDQIAALWGADIVYYEGKPHAFWNEEGSVIFLNNSDSIPKQRSDFFHELSHIVQHEGDQGNLPGLFVDLQETQAWHFSLIASMPHYLLPVPLEMTKDVYVRLLADEFHVPQELAADRVEQIVSRLHDDYYYQRENVELLKSKIQIAVAFQRLNSKRKVIPINKFKA